MFISRSLCGIISYYIRGIDQIADLSVSSLISSAVTICCNILFLVVFERGSCVIVKCVWCRGVLCLVVVWGVCGGCFGSWCHRGGVGSAGLVERAVAQHAVDDVASSACQAHDRRVVAFAFGLFAVVVGA